MTRDAFTVDPSAHHPLRSAVNMVTRTLALVGIACLILAILVTVGDIIWRRIGGQSFIGVVDVTQLSVMVAASFSIPFAFANGGHVTVELLGKRVTATTIRILDVIALILGALLSGFLTWLTWQRAAEIMLYGDVSQDLAIPMILYWGALVVGLGLSVLVCIANVALRLLEGDIEHGC